MDRPEITLLTLLYQRAVEANTLKVDSFSTVNLQTAYDRPLLDGKTPSLVVNNTNQVVLAPAQYTLVGSTFTFVGYVPAANEQIVIIYS